MRLVQNPGQVKWQDANDNLDWALAFRYTIDDAEEDYCVMADTIHDGIEIYGPLALDDPGLTYAERIGKLLEETLGEDNISKTNHIIRRGH